MRTRKGRKVEKTGTKVCQNDKAEPLPVLYYNIPRGNGKSTKSYKQMLELMATHTGRRA